ncbi:MAG: hypothetical protein AAF549_04515 [Pseudomonadota bacterium]
MSDDELRDIRAALKDEEKITTRQRVKAYGRAFMSGIGNFVANVFDFSDVRRDMKDLFGGSPKTTKRSARSSTPVKSIRPKDGQDFVNAALFQTEAQRVRNTKYTGRDARSPAEDFSVAKPIAALALLGGIAAWQMGLFETSETNTVTDQGASAPTAQP